MAAVFLVTLFEYSPLFYISVVSFCFLVTAAMVLGWFRLDVPVILRSSDDSQSILPTPEKHMVQVTNPFGLQVGGGASSVIGGVCVRPCCLKPCVLSCFWGCEIIALQGALWSHQTGPALSYPLQFRAALQQYSLHLESFNVSSEDGAEIQTQIPADFAITDFGPLPRERYPLVCVLTLAEQEDRDTHHIVSSVSVLHVPDDKHRLSARVLFQFLLTAKGNMYELKPLFMSAESGGSSTVSEQSSSPTGPHTEEQSPDQEEDQEGEQSWSLGSSRDCVVCQNAAVNRVLLPCRHACVCDGCVSHFQHCPICRAFIRESFTLTHTGSDPGPSSG